MEIVVVGTGYVGLVTAVCLAEYGHKVTCVDIDENKINKLRDGISPIYEQDLEELMKKNSKRLRYTTDYMSAYKDAEVIFIGVGTPEKKDGSANLSYVYAVAKQIAESVDHSCVVVLKSTVPIGTNDKVLKILNDNKKTSIKINIVSNPEFLAQGTAVRDTLHASRIVIGVDNEDAEKVMREVYKEYDAPILVTDSRSAEMVKYASNDFLALKISYINEIANLCEIVGAKVEDVAKGMGYDSRIGDKFLNAGIGYGGSCFPKDTKALHWLANMNDYELKTVKAAIEVNEQQKLRLIKKSRKYYDNFEGLTVAILGLTFKPGTDDLREAASIINIPIILDDGANIKAFDPVGIENFKKTMKYGDVEGLDRISYFNNIDDTIKDTDICFIFTEWDEIKNYDISKFRKLMKRPILLDGRNCYSLSDAESYGVIYMGIGK
ncbi:UDP-glucose/GDP-mannose dehydrogenase family protein [Paenibacillus sp. FSL H7-0737]|uniref:UDP-glucose dehydrogenase family protein n=1 Tax=Paenibacillus sp. FSL H7-0737 TaxID=1536775 RepID=UPI0004F6E9C9|nr:UDP-glucose/GDP-mannose dehydrogenase family protein [Paenibacillus sp. FSL H7-0737]AIQ25714.1 UDP-glucose 6-dehydrogenase [Paenibacillus sp. FSL H7-0737]